MSERRSWGRGHRECGMKNSMHQTPGAERGLQAFDKGQACRKQHVDKGGAARRKAGGWAVVGQGAFLSPVFTPSPRKGFSLPSEGHESLQNRQKARFTF